MHQHTSNITKAATLPTVMRVTRLVLSKNRTEIETRKVTVAHIKPALAHCISLAHSIATEVDSLGKRVQNSECFKSFARMSMFGQVFCCLFRCVAGLSSVLANEEKAYYDAPNTGQNRDIGQYLDRATIRIWIFVISSRVHARHGK